MSNTIAAAVIGASGNVGARITKELAGRGHSVTAIVRNPDKVARLANVTAIKGDVMDQAGLATLLKGHEVAISSVHFLDSEPAKLIAAAKAIKDKTGNPGFAVRHQISEETPWWIDFSNWSYGFGGAWSKDGKLTINSPENVAAVTAYRDMYKSGAMAVGDDASTFRSKFQQGKIGIDRDKSPGITEAHKALGEEA